MIDGATAEPWVMGGPWHMDRAAWGRPHGVYWVINVSMHEYGQMPKVPRRIKPVELASALRLFLGKFHVRSTELKLWALLGIVSFITARDSTSARLTSCSVIFMLKKVPIVVKSPST